MSETAFAAVAREAARLTAVRIRDLFAADPRRAEALTLCAAHLRMDFSKQRIDAAALAALAQFARAAGFEEARKRLFAGDIVNNTEKRPAWHTALRAAHPPAEVTETRARMRAFAAAHTDIDAVVHLGIGGSDLGPRLVLDALKPLRRPGLSVRFAANIDGAEIADALEGLNPARTLVIVCSKTFTTLETLSNAAAARDWLGAHAGGRIAAVTAAPEKAAAWGVDEANIFPFWDWVGGRYSLWSAIGLVLEIALQDNAFGRLCEGARAMDTHFESAPFEANAPALAAAVQVWNREARGCGSYALIPYAHRLQMLPAYLQQLEMESNGKRVDREGRPIARPAAFVTWGAAGTVAQHSFFQMLHQGVQEIPVEFLIVETGAEGPPTHRAPLLANALAQARALMLGKSESEAKADMIAQGLSEAEAQRLAPHRAFPGDRPSTLIGLDALTPEALGALLAFYEHRTFTQGVMSGINPFDQFGVELGKQMATQLTPALEGARVDGLDPSTAAWAARLGRTQG
ncbi:MAG: glucose-6-phosphate isomerase [Hyphomonadaceae bacterium]